MATFGSAEAEGALAIELVLNWLGLAGSLSAFPLHTAGRISNSASNFLYYFFKNMICNNIQYIV